MSGGFNLPKGVELPADVAQAVRETMEEADLDRSDKGLPAVATLDGYVQELEARDVAVEEKVRRTLLGRVRGLFSRRKTAAASETPSTSTTPDSEASEVSGAMADSSGTKKSRRAKQSNQAAPVQVVIGYLQGVSKADALEYALGLAGKHFQQAEAAWYDAHPWLGGFVFEAHEGGHGRAYVPAILKHFASLDDAVVGEESGVNVRTGTRTLQVRRTRDGLIALLMPEGSAAQQPDWLVATEHLRPAVNKRTGLLVAGSVVFVTGFAAMLVTSMLTRYQPWEPAPDAPVFSPSVAALPMSMWPRLERFTVGPLCVSALRFSGGKWAPVETRPCAEQAEGKKAPASGPSAARPDVPPPLPDILPPKDSKQ